MQTPRLIPRLIEVCDYCRGELCRRTLTPPRPSPRHLANVVFRENETWKSLPGLSCPSFNLDVRNSSISFSLADIFSSRLEPCTYVCVCARARARARAFSRFSIKVWWARWKLPVRPGTVRCANRIRTCSRDEAININCLMRIGAPHLGCCKVCRNN